MPFKTIQTLSALVVVGLIDPDGIGPCSLASDPERVLRSKAQPGRAGRSWILVLVDGELPTRPAVPRFFGGRGGVRAGNEDIDAGNVEALRAVQPHGEFSVAADLPRCS
jgi:hypothetical protein